MLGRYDLASFAALLAKADGRDEPGPRDSTFMTRYKTAIREARVDLKRRRENSSKLAERVERLEALVAQQSSDASTGETFRELVEAREERRENDFPREEMIKAHKAIIWLSQCEAVAKDLGSLYSVKEAREAESRRKHMADLDATYVETTRAKTVPAPKQMKMLKLSE